MDSVSKSSKTELTEPYLSELACLFSTTDFRLLPFSFLHFILKITFVIFADSRSGAHRTT